VITSANYTASKCPLETIWIAWTLLDATCYHKHSLPRLPYLLNITFVVISQRPFGHIIQVGYIQIKYSTLVKKGFGV